ncbi:hypothetical protein [Haloferula sp. BvORR071]|uniref:hypothetical protein n=1 Tax=Haloferula sp. BvORR071 TaxID=1396141 RepID=UPI00055398D2|nr:hypothetical protein [Haloferula sp. BvORR071]
MELSEIKNLLTAIETQLDSNPVSELGTFETPAGKLSVALTERFRKSCRKGKVWKSNAMLTALKNSNMVSMRIAPVVMAVLTVFSCSIAASSPETR